MRAKDSPSMDPTDPMPPIGIHLELHDSESDDAIDNPRALVDRIEANTETMARCKSIYDRLAGRNEDNKLRHSRMMGQFTAAPILGSWANEPIVGRAAHDRH